MLHTHTDSLSILTTEEKQALRQMLSALRTQNQWLGLVTEAQRRQHSHSLRELVIRLRRLSPTDF